MAAVLMETLERIQIMDLTGQKYGYKDLKDEKHQEFLRGMAWAACMVKGYELAFEETGNKTLDAQLIDYRDQYQAAVALKLEQDCGAMLLAMIDEERGGVPG